MVAASTASAAAPLAPHTQLRAIAARAAPPPPALPSAPPTHRACAAPAPSPAAHRARTTGRRQTAARAGQLYDTPDQTAPAAPTLRWSAAGFVAPECRVSYASQAPGHGERALAPHQPGRAAPLGSSRLGAPRCLYMARALSPAPSYMTTARSHHPRSNARRQRKQPPPARIQPPANNTSRGRPHPTARRQHKLRPPASNRHIRPPAPNRPPTTHAASTRACRPLPAARRTARCRAPPSSQRRAGRRRRRCRPRRPLRRSSSR